MFGLRKKLGQRLALASPSILTHKTGPQKSQTANPTACGSPRELNLVITLFPGCWSVVMLLEGKELRIFIPTNGAKMGFSG